MTDRSELPQRVLALLQAGPRSLDQLAAGLPGVSHEVIEQTVQDLERRGRLTTQHLLTDPPRTIHRATKP